MSMSRCLPTRSGHSTSAAALETAASCWICIGNTTCQVSRIHVIKRTQTMPAATGRRLRPKTNFSVQRLPAAATPGVCRPQPRTKATMPCTSFRRLSHCTVMMVPQRQTLNADPSSGERLHSGNKTTPINHLISTLPSDCCCRWTLLGQDGLGRVALLTKLFAKVGT